MKKAAKKSEEPEDTLKARLAGLHIAPENLAADRLKDTLLPVIRAWLDEKNAQVKRDFFATGDIIALLNRHTEAVDQLLCALYHYITGAEDAGAVVAIGGYGRRELFPFSDLDLLFLYAPQESPQATATAEFILYVLWDLGFKVGQSHRTVEEAIALSHSDCTIRTGLLDSRFITGKKALYDEFYARFEKEIIASDTLEFVDAKLSERETRHTRFGQSRYMLEPNVKEGKGGLRDLHTLWWLARYVYGIRSFKDLRSRHLLSTEEYRAFDQARQFLCKVRAHLHYLAGRPEERLSFDRQLDVAREMGFVNPSPNRAIERFMRRYFAHVATVGNVTRIFCALLEEEKKRKPRHPFARLFHVPWLGAFKLEGERLTVKSEDAFAQHPILMIELFQTAQRFSLDIHPRALQLIGRYARLIDASVQQDPKACALFMDILLSGKNPEGTLRRMSEAGVLGKFIPEFGRITFQTQFNMYHAYTVDEHTLRAIGVLTALERGELGAEAPMATSIMRRIQMRKVVFLALLCHDIAKGRASDHSELGEKLMRKLAVRFGFNANETDTAAWLVRYHLLFSNTAFKRDLSDPKTILDFVSIVQTPERLKLLLVLTVADIRAVGPGIWNEWKASLLRELYTRAEECIGTGTPVIHQQETEQFKQELSKLLPGWSGVRIQHYMELTTPGFLANCAPGQHAIIAQMLAEAEHMPLPLLIDTQHDYERAVTEVIIATYDQSGLFSKMTGALSLAGANIISAKIFTLKNGMAVDIFQIKDHAGEVFDRPGRLAKMSVYLDQALSGELDLENAFAGGLRETKSGALGISGQVFIENDASALYTVIELAARDKTGFLYEVTKAMAALGLSIVTAHITTYGTQISDVFYVKDAFGMKITHEGKMKEVRERLLLVVSG